MNRERKEKGREEEGEGKEGLGPVVVEHRGDPSPTVTRPERKRRDVRPKRWRSRDTVRPGGVGGHRSSISGQVSFRDRHPVGNFRQ